MTIYTDDCCGCAAPSYPCLGRRCPNRSVPHIVCDGCKEELDVVNFYKDMELCSECYDALMEVET